MCTGESDCSTVSGLNCADAELRVGAAILSSTLSDEHEALLTGSMHWPQAIEEREAVSVDHLVQAQTELVDKEETMSGNRW